MRINNLYSEHKDIYVFYRDDSCNLKITKFQGFFPYWYEPDPSGNFESFKGEKLRKIIISEPAEIRKKASTNAFESDIQFVKRFMIDKVDVIEPAPIKYCFIDIETLTTEMPNVQNAEFPISCISAYNSLSKTIQTFYLPEYESEYKMIDAFVAYMAKEKFDIWFSWNVKFDFNYLANRFPDFIEKISPISKSRYGDGEVKYPAGISIVDYLSWFQKITLGREKQYTLDYIAQKFLKVPPKAKVDFSKLSPELKQHNIEDIKLLVGLEEQMRLVSYYDEIRRITQVEWEDFEFNSRSIDMLLLKEAKQRNLVLPNRPTGEGEEENFEGAFRDIYETGRLEAVGKTDVSSAYPYAIIEFCLDPANVVQDSGENIIQVGDNYFKQDSKALIPTIIKKLLVLKATIKKELADCSVDDTNHKNIKLKYDAIKSLCNTCFTPDTEIITQNGIVNIKDIKIGDKIYNTNPETLETEEDEVIETQQFYKDEEIYHYNSQMVDLKLTKEHNVLFTQYKMTSFASIEYLYHNAKTHWLTPKVLPVNTKDEAQIISLYDIVIKHKGIFTIVLDPYAQTILMQNKKALYNKYNFKYDEISEEQLKYFYLNGWKVLGSIREKTKKTPIFYQKIDFVKFLGWFLSEGSMYKNKRQIYKTSIRGITSRFSISQCKTINDVYRTEIINLLEKMGFGLFIDTRSINFVSDILFEYMLPYYISEKNIPNWLFHTSAKNIRAFLDCYYKGDGHKRQNCLTCKPKLLFSQLLNLYILTGNNSFSVRNDGCYRLRVGNQTGKLRSYIHKEHYKGNVYCLTTKKNHTVFAGRNGHFSLIGQCYGVTALKFFRLFDVRVASATTFIVRSLLHYIKDKLDNSGHSVVYIDTDGIFAKNYTEETNKQVNIWTQEWAKELFGKEKINITFDFEGVYESILLLAKCRYVGRLRKTNGELEVETKGIEAKRKDSTKYMGNFQKILIDKILDKEPKEKIYNWIKEEITNFPKQNIIDISFPCKMAKAKIEYKNIPVFSRALDNTPEFKNKMGDSFYYIYMEGTDESKKDMVRAFDEDRYEHINREEVDWQRMLERNIIMKLSVIFEAMKWTLTDIYTAPPTSKICDKCLKDKSFCRFPKDPYYPNTCKACITLIEKENKPHRVKKIDKIVQSIPLTPAREVSKQTRIASSDESVVKVHDLAPISIPKAKDYATDFDLNKLEIREIDYSLAKEYISENHYSHTLGCSIQVSLGFYYNNELVSAIIYGDPVGINVKSFLQTEGNSLELVRLFSKDGLPKNTESYCIGKSFKYLKEKYSQFKYLISYADANHGHCGYIYQATNWKYIGLSSKDGHPTIFIDGKNVHPRSLYSKHGTSSTIELQKIYGNRLELRKKLQKHVYLMCLGNHKECKEWYSKFTFLPYPKAINGIITGKYKADTTIKEDKQSDKDLVTGTPVKSLKKRGRPRKIKKPEDLNYGKNKTC